MDDWAVSSPLSETLEQRFAGHMGRLLGPDFPRGLGLAVSGGGDSMAMLSLAHGWARIYGVGLRIVTIDHGLRAESATEAAMVATECAALGHPHDTLTWHWNGQGNLQDAARRARLTLIGDWADGAPVLFAHTVDDQAETVLMRLARGSGVDGLAAMAERRTIEGRMPWKLIRPLLHENRADLRHYVETLKVPYVDDPSNDDPRFDRVRMRQAIATLGLDTAGLARTATRMARAREALTARVVDLAEAAARQERVSGAPTGNLLINRDLLAGAERETQMRLLAEALCWVSSNPYKPRALALENLLDRVLAGGSGNLHGCLAITGRDRVRIAREYAAVKGLVVPVGSVWDQRWETAASEDVCVRALGPDGWQQVGNKQKGLPPHDACLAIPALFDGDRLVACNVLQFGPEYAARLHPSRASFAQWLVSR